MYRSKTIAHQVSTRCSTWTLYSVTLLSCIYSEPTLCIGYLLRKMYTVAGVLTGTQNLPWLIQMKNLNKVTSYRGDRNKWGRDDGSWSAIEKKSYHSSSLRVKGRKCCRGSSDSWSSGGRAYPVGSVNLGTDSCCQESDTETKRRRWGRNTQSFSFCVLIFWSFHFPASKTNDEPFVQGTLVMQRCQHQSWAKKKCIWGPIQENPAPQIYCILSTQ